MKITIENKEITIEIDSVTFDELVEAVQLFDSAEWEDYKIKLIGVPRKTSPHPSLSGGIICSSTYAKYPSSLTGVITCSSTYSK